MSFILGKLTLNNFTVIEPKPDFPLIRVGIKGQSQRLLFVFETAGEHREFMEFMLRYIDFGDHNGICSLSLILSLCCPKVVDQSDDTFILQLYREKEIHRKYPRKTLSTTDQHQNGG